MTWGMHNEDPGRPTQDAYAPQLLMITREYDVIVVGGGVAGAAAALALLSRGQTVAMLSRGSRRVPQFGETVSGSVVQQLIELGLRETFRVAGHAPAPGKVVLWGGREAEETDAIFDPYGPGWHLDRTAFDDMLFDAAFCSGADAFRWMNASYQYVPTRGWIVTCSEPGMPTLHGRWAIDATGRGAFLARRQGVRRNRLDNLVGLVRFQSEAPTVEPRTLIESCELGWWYGAALPDDHFVTALFTDADLLPGSKAGREQLWNRLRDDTLLIADRAPRGGRSSSLHMTAASSGILSTCADISWLAIGDASQTWDPLSGQGILNALSSAARTVEVTAVSGAERQAGVAEFNEHARQQYQAYLHARCAYYGRERCWQDSPFWRRRSDPDTAKIVDHREDSCAS